MADEVVLDNSMNPKFVTSQIFAQAKAKVESVNTQPEKPAPKKAEAPKKGMPEFKEDPEISLPNEAWTLKDTPPKEKPAPIFEESEDEESEEESESEESSDEEGGEEGEQSAAAIPSYNIEMDDGDALEVRGNSMVIVETPDGKQKKVPFSEVMDKLSKGYEIESAQVKIQERERGVRQKEDQVNQKITNLQEVDQMVAKALKRVQDGAGLEAFHEVIELSGKYESPIDWEVQMLETVVPLVKDLLGMDPEDRDNWLRNRKANYIIEKEKRAKESKKETPEQATRRAEIDATKRIYNLSDDEWNSAVKLLKAVSDRGDLERYKIKEVTPAVVADLALTQKAAPRVDSRFVNEFPELRKKLGEERFQDVRKTLIETVKSLDLDESEIDSLIRDASSEILKSEEDEKDEKVLSKKASALSVGRKRSKATGPIKKPIALRTFADAREFVQNRFKS